MFSHRADMLCARGQVHIETLIMTSVGDRDGTRDSIGFVSLRLSSPTETAGWSSHGSIFEVKTRLKKNHID